MSEWKSIETAPKDGTFMLLGHTCKHIPLAGYWHIGKRAWCMHWGGSRSNEDCLLVGSFEPTHWMPLPEPPDAPK